MLRLEQINKGVQLKGIIPSQTVEIIDVLRHDPDVIEIIYKTINGDVHSEILYRDNEELLSLAEKSAPWSFNGNSELFRLVSEAYRIKLAYIFDPLMAVNSSMIEPLPHQITAVYDSMLPRQPLRFLLADDPGAGKTIMAGLLIKELVIRGDVRRCLIICPGSLAEQWQDELYYKFQLPFEILTNDKINASRTGNWFLEENLVIARLDKLSRDEDLQNKLKITEWDLVIVDEAHKMSASFFGGEIKYTKRFKLGKLISKYTRHFLLMTATPHNGKEEDFQLFLSLLDVDRFEGRFRDGVHSVDTTDIMRRLLKEQLVKFDGKPLFPERIAETVPYELSPLEEQLYSDVTEYVREQFNRADQLESGRRGTVGFALTILQRRLASSPEAIYQSIKRRKERLQARLENAKVYSEFEQIKTGWNYQDIEDIEDYADDADADEREELENDFLDKATAAQTIKELEAEIEILKNLETLAKNVRNSGLDKKWEELSKIISDKEWMIDGSGHRRKLVIFTEHRDTLNYLTQRIANLIGNPNAVVNIKGGMSRQERKKAEEEFKQNVNVSILAATDAAGEGINLQRAHLMVNYDLPWNPNRLEQRFGRIHRIGQTEVCRLWNLIAFQTREGQVWQRLFTKLEQEKDSLKGQVFDVLGEMTFENRSLKDLLIEAIRYGNDPERKAFLDRVVDESLDREKLNKLLAERALHSISFTHSNVQLIREEMERAQARKLQPHFIADFFIAAFQKLGGRMVEKEKNRYQILNVPSRIRNRDQVTGTREPVIQSYERVTFFKEKVSIQSKPPAEFICPGHPLLDATINLILEANQNLLKQGSILIDDLNPDSEPRILYYLENSIQDSNITEIGTRRTISREVHFLEIKEDGSISQAGWAPFLDYRPLKPNEAEVARQKMEKLNWLKNTPENKVKSFALTTIAKNHLERIKKNKTYLVEKTKVAVNERLTNEIHYWDHRARELRIQEEAGKPNARLNSNEARKRADDLQGRLDKRMDELEKELKISSRPPVIIGGALILPASLITESKINYYKELGFASYEEKTKVEISAMKAVAQIETELGNVPVDKSKENLGYDIESVDGTDRNLRFIEVKGRKRDAETVTISRNEILCGLNSGKQYYLAIAMVDGNQINVHYVQNIFKSEPNFGSVSENFKIKNLLEKTVLSKKVNIE